MYDKLREHRGAVAVFLVIVLVPMITCASLFVEVARVKLAQSLVSSAGDLALNTYMTNYDFDLNDYYGMLASAQDMSDVSAAIDDYLKACLVSQGVDTTYLNSYVNSIKGMFSDDSDISDYLQITIAENSCSVTPTTNGALNNAALVKTQIVDFMKYRSPINAASSLLESLAQIGNETKNLPDQTACAEKQQEFYETEEDLMKTAKKAYDQIVQYEDLKITKTYVENLLDSIKKYPEDYKNIYRKYVYDLAGTDNITQFSKQTIYTTYTSKSVVPYSESKHASWGTTKNLVISVADAMQSYLQAKKNLQSVVNLYSYNKNSTYVTRYYLNVIKELNKNNQYSKYVSAANSLTKKMAQLTNAYENMEEVTDRNINLKSRTGVNTYGDKSIDNHYDSLLKQYNSIKSDFTNTQSAYNVLGNRLTSCYNTISNNSSNVPNTNEEPKGGINRSPADSMVSDIYNAIKGYKDKIKEGEKQITDAVGTLEKLKKLISTYKTDYSEWKTATYKPSLEKNAYAEKAKEDITQREQNPDIMKNLTQENVQALINRLNNIKSALGTMKSCLDGFKFKGKKIADIKNLKDFESASGVNWQDIGITKTEINSYINSNYSFSQTDSNLGITNNNNPALDVNTPAVYTWMKNNLDKPDESKKTKKEAEDQYDSLKKSKDDKMGGEETDVQLGANKEDISKQKNLPSKNAATSTIKTEKSSDISKLTTFITELFGNLGETISNAGTTVRDNLYTVDYIMSMFSYDTYESEGMFEMWHKDHPNDAITSTIDFKSGYTEKWKKPAQTDHFHKSLTNHMIDDSTCFSYGNEVEYILYGGTNAKNKATAYGTIYMIRLALDIGPVFSKYFSHTAVNTLATTISAATSGIIPVPVVKFAICLGLSAAEAATDLSYIKKGLGVKLIKTRDDLFMSFENESMSAGKNDGALGVGGLFFQYSDYLQILMFVSLLNSDKANAIYLRTADVIQVNMNKLTKPKGGYLMSKAQIYYTLNVDITVKPLLLPVPMIDNHLSASGSDNNASTKSSEGYKKFEKAKWNTFSYVVTRGY